MHLPAEDPVAVLDVSVLMYPHLFTEFQNYMLASVGKSLFELGQAPKKWRCTEEASEI